MVHLWPSIYGGIDDFPVSGRNKEKLSTYFTNFNIYIKKLFVPSHCFCSVFFFFLFITELLYKVKSHDDREESMEPSSDLQTDSV